MEVGDPGVGEVTYGGSTRLSRKRDQIKMRVYMDRRVTSHTCGPLPPCKQALRKVNINANNECFAKP